MYLVGLYIYCKNDTRTLQCQVQIYVYIYILFLSELLCCEDTDGWNTYVGTCNTVVSFPVLALSQYSERRLYALSCLSVPPHGTNRLTLEGFLWNLIYQYVLKFCRENSSCIKIWQQVWVLYMKAYVYKFFLEWEMFQTNVEKIKTRIMFTNFFRTSCSGGNMLKPNRPQITI